MSRVQSNLTLFLFHFLQGVRDHIRTVAKAVKKTILYTAQTGIRAEDEFAAIEILYYLCF